MYPIEHSPKSWHAKLARERPRHETNRPNLAVRPDSHLPDRLSLRIPASPPLIPRRHCSCHVRNGHSCPLPSKLILISLLPTPQTSCHSVSNDCAHCQAFFGDTAASTPERAPFRSSRTFLTPRLRSSLYLISQRDLRPHHPSLRDLLPRLLTSISPTFSGRRAAHSNARLLLAGHGMTRAHLHDGLT
jgi:hypothetical protein